MTFGNSDKDEANRRAYENARKDYLGELAKARTPDWAAADMAINTAGATETPLRVFLRDVENEVSRAQRKFPDSGGATVALMEEVGELAHALLDESPQRIYAEAMQVACMAARVALEGDRSLDEYRVHHFGMVNATSARGKRE